MLEEETLEARRLHGKEATEFESEVNKLVERWQYLLKIPFNVEVVAVKHVRPDPNFGAQDATIEIVDEDNSKAKLEIGIEDRHPYSLEKLVVHELLHLPTIELKIKIYKKLTKRTKERIQQEVFYSNPLGWDETMVDYWAETLVCLAHGFYPIYGAPPQDDFFNSSHRIPLDLRIQRDTGGEYKSPALRVPMSEIPQIYDNCNFKMSGLL